MFDVFETGKLSVTESELSETISRDGETVRIDIYKGEEEGWFLEIVDINHNSTCWDDTFETEQDALDMAIASIDDQGIQAFIDPDNQ
ncbi:MAG: hypothetical protein HQL46_09130 [Gammaproteobacteria bacterium]|nr:hypothetical protein [Gammaproteobacteria bacterium]